MGVSICGCEESVPVCTYRFATFHGGKWSTTVTYSNILHQLLLQEWDTINCTWHRFEEKPASFQSANALIPWTAKYLVFLKPHDEHSYHLKMQSFVSLTVITFFLFKIRTLVNFLLNMMCATRYSASSPAGRWSLCLPSLVASARSWL